MQVVVGLRQVIGPERHPLEQLDRRAAVGDPEGQNRHGSLSSPPWPGRAGPSGPSAGAGPVVRAAGDASEAAGVDGRRPPAHLGQDRLALFVEGQDLQLDRQVHLAERHAGRHRDERRGEVQDRSDARRHHPVRDLLRGPGRGADHADRDLALPDDLRQVVDVLNPQPAGTVPHLARVRVHERDRLEPALREAAVVREGVPEVPDPGDDDRPVLRQAELPADLVDQIGHVVAHAARPVRPEVGQVLPHLRRVHPGGLGERL